jgi:predicted nucleotidyltransferase
MGANLPPSLDRLLARFDNPTIAAIALVGSHARGDAGPHSDIDVLRLRNSSDASSPATGSYLIDGHLVVVSDVTPSEVEDWFSRPELAVRVISGLRLAHRLVDREERFADVQRRAEAFTWDAELQKQADRWASQQMVGWAEEAHKGLEGLRRGDIGRLLNARHGLSWGLCRVVQVQRGILESGDNAFYEEVAEAIGPSSSWVRLLTLAFGIGAADGEPAPSLFEQVRAGLDLYVVTAQLLDGILQPQDRPVVDDTMNRIQAVMTGD